MASSVDRYRPPTRDNFAPPSAAAATAAALNGTTPRLSRSPVRQPKELASSVPPPVPTPPFNSASATPPPPSLSQSQPQSRSQSQSTQPPAQLPPRSHPTTHTPHQRSPPSSASPTHPQSPSRARADPWIFSPDEVLSSPSIIDGLSPKELRLRRAKGVNFIYQVGCILQLPQLTQWVAGVFFHRFYMRYSMVEEKGGLHHYNIAATSVFLACKAEENCRKTKSVIIAVAKVAQKNPSLLIDEQSKEYWRWRDSILTYEELMLEYLTFDVSVANPYTIFFDILGQFGLRDDKELRQAAWAFCNDACLTHMPLIMTAREVAVSAICFASFHTGHQIDDVDGEAWWRLIGADEYRCLEAVRLMADFYLENPLQKRNPALASPGFHLDTTRRRGESPNSQAGSSVGTPDVVAGGGPRQATASPPRSVPNGDRANHHHHHHDVAPSVSPVKRKTSAEEGDDENGYKSDDGNDDGGRASKRARLSEDEGELPDE